jgi:hypothetical protein
MLPTFLIIGAQKAATTTLYEVLRQHPDVFMPDLKETNYFIEQGNLARGQAWYESLFDGAGDALHRGEASPGYTMFPHFRGAPARAAAIVPEVRLIYVIRHPVDRMRSAWTHHTGEGLEDRDLEYALREHAHYQLVSCYGLQVAQWLAEFPREQLLVLRLDDIRDDPGGTLDRVLAHLGLPAGWRPADLGHSWNTSAGKTMPPRWLRAAAGVARRLGRERLAVRFGPLSRVFGRFARPITPDAVALDPDLEIALRDLFRADLVRLRSLVDPELDVWGLA